MTSPEQLRRLRRLLEVLNAPLDFEGSVEWRREVADAARALTGADSAAFALPWDEAQPIATFDIDPQSIQDFVERFAALDTGHLRRMELGLEVFGQSQVYPADFEETELYRDFVLKYRIHHGVGVAVDDAEGSVWFAVYRDRPDPRFEARTLPLLELALPAFKAGLATIRAMHRRQAGLAAMLDQLREPLLLCDAAGRPLHANTALVRALEADPERDVLRRALQTAADVLASLIRAPGKTRSPIAIPGERTVRTRSDEYRVRASLVGEDVVARERGILVALEPTSVAFPRAARLRERFGLTRREAEIALLLAQGRKTADIARDLVISRHTVRRHTENVLRKLGVPSRAAVAARILHP
ncbi:MAG TPA: helix-turn-helix transcriptional regulator [Longimicrobiales bacterium]